MIIFYSPWNLHVFFINFIALHGHLETVQKILSYEDCDKDIQDSCGTTPLMDAASGNHRHIVEYLIQVKKVISVLSFDNFTQPIIIYCLFCVIVTHNDVLCFY